MFSNFATLFKMAVSSDEGRRLTATEDEGDEDFEAVAGAKGDEDFEAAADAKGEQDFEAAAGAKGDEDLEAAAGAKGDEDLEHPAVDEKGYDA